MWAAPSTGLVLGNDAEKYRTGRGTAPVPSSIHFARRVRGLRALVKSQSTIQCSYVFRLSTLLGRVNGPCPPIRHYSVRLWELEHDRKEVLIRLGTRPISTHGTLGVPARSCLRATASKSNDRVVMLGTEPLGAVSRSIDWEPGEGTNQPPREMVWNMLTAQNYINKFSLQRRCKTNLASATISRSAP